MEGVREAGSAGLEEVWVEGPPAVPGDRTALVVGRARGIRSLYSPAGSRWADSRQGSQSDSQCLRGTGGGGVWRVGCGWW